MKDAKEIKTAIVEIPNEVRIDMQIHALKKGLKLYDYTNECVIAGHELLSKQNSPVQESRNSKVEQ